MTLCYCAFVSDKLLFDAQAFFKKKCYRPTVCFVFCVNRVTGLNTSADNIRVLPEKGRKNAHVGAVMVSDWCLRRSSLLGVLLLWQIYDCVSNALTLQSWFSRITWPETTREFLLSNTPSQRAFNRALQKVRPVSAITEAWNLLVLFYFIFYREIHFNVLTTFY